MIQIEFASVKSTLYAISVALTIDDPSMLLASIVIAETVSPSDAIPNFTYELIDITNAVCPQCQC